MDWGMFLALAALNVSLFGWLRSDMKDLSAKTDKRLDALSEKIDKRLDALSEKIDKQGEDLRAVIAKLAEEVVAIKTILQMMGYPTPFKRTGTDDSDSK